MKALGLIVLGGVVVFVLLVAFGGQQKTPTKDTYAMLGVMQAVQDNCSDNIGPAIVRFKEVYGISSRDESINQTIISAGKQTALSLYPSASDKRQFCALYVPKTLELLN
jgi:hypothetical protein